MKNLFIPDKYTNLNFDMADYLFHDYFTKALPILQKKNDRSIARRTLLAFQRLADSKPIYKPCQATPSTGCSKSVQYIVFPVVHKKLVLNKPFFYCGDDDCLSVFLENMSDENVYIVLLSFRGLKHIIKEYPRKAVADAFTSYLAEVLGLNDNEHEAWCTSIVDFLSGEKLSETEERDRIEKSKQNILKK
jgi:hypothetical protein